MPDEPAADVISGGRDPDRRPAGPALPAGPWRRLAVVAAAVLIAGWITFHLTLGGPGRPPHRTPQGSPSAAALLAPAMLHGTPWRPGGAPGTVLFLGGEQLRILNVPRQGLTSFTGVPLGAGGPGDPLGPDPAVQQINSVAGGVVVLVSGHGSAGLPDIGDVLFVPVSASEAGPPRLIARANYMAVAPNRREIWVEQAAPPWGNGPASSPTWLVGEDGHRLSGARGLNGRVLVAATVRGLLVKSPDQRLALVDPVNGRPEPIGIPADAIIAGADADHVAWQSASCGPRCPLHVTDVRGGPDAVIPLPAHTAINPDDTSDFDPSGQRLALPLDTIDHQGAEAGTYVYVADTGARTLARVPGPPVPVTALPAVPGAFPAGSSNVVSACWATDGPGLWIVASDGLFFQLAYWTGHGPLHVLPPRGGLAYKFAVPGQ